MLIIEILIKTFIFLTLGLFMGLSFLYVCSKRQEENLDDIIARGIGNSIFAKRMFKEAKSMYKSQEPGRKIIPPVIERPRPHTEKKKDMKIFKNERKKSPQTTQEPKKRRTSLKDKKNIA